MSLEDIIDWVEENPRDAGIRIFALERENIILERENAVLRSLLREAIREHVDPYDLPEGDHYIARAKAVLGIPPTQEAVTAARAKEAKP